MSVLLNNSLPLNIKVLEKTSYNRYLLKFGNKTLSTKSLKELTVGGEYWGEISQNGNLISVSNLIQKPNFGAVLADGVSLIEKVLFDENLHWFYEMCINGLKNAQQKVQFELYGDILMALNQNIIHIVFEYENQAGLFQLKRLKDRIYCYLIYLNFAPLLFEFQNAALIKIKTPYNVVKSLLKGFFECEICVENFEMLYNKDQNLVDFRG